MDIFFTEIVLSLVSFAFNRTHGSTPFKLIVLYFRSSRQRWEPSEGVPSVLTGQSVPRTSHPEESDAFGLPGPSENGGWAQAAKPPPLHSLKQPRKKQNPGLSPEMYGREISMSHCNVLMKLGKKYENHHRRVTMSYCPTSCSSCWNGSYLTWQTLYQWVVGSFGHHLFICFYTL